MKNVLKYSGIISFVAAAVAFILLMVTRGIVDPSAPAESWFSSGAVLFGRGPARATVYILFVGNVTINNNDWVGQASGAALTAWIFTLVSLLGLSFGLVLPLLKKKVSDRIAGIVNLCSVLLLITAGILVFFTVPSFCGSNGFRTDGWSLSFGYVLSAILLIVGGAFAVLPTVMDFVGNRK